MVECGNRTRLGQRAMAGLPGFQHAGRQTLQGDQTAQPRVPCLVDDTHSSLAKRPEAFVTPMHVILELESHSLPRRVHYCSRVTREMRACKDCDTSM